MSVYNHDPSSITDGAALDPDAMKAILASLDAAEGDLSTMPTTYKDDLAGAIGEVHADALEAYNRANDAVGDAALAQDAADAAQADVDGLTTRFDEIHETDGTLSAGVVGAGALSAATVAMPGDLIFDPCFVFIPPGMDFGGRRRWTNGHALTRITGDSNNTFGGVTLRHTTAAGSVAKRVPISEKGMAPGDTFTSDLHVRAAAGTYRKFATFLDGSDATISTVYSATTTMDGTVKKLSIPETTIPANTVTIQFGGQRVTGSEPTDWYCMPGARGAFLSSVPTIGIPDVAPSPNIMFDPLNVETISAGNHWGGFIRYINQNATSFADGDTDNPLGGRTMTITGTSGRYLLRSEVGGADNDLVSMASLVMATDDGTWNLDLGFLTADYTLIGSATNSGTLNPTTPTLLAVSARIPNGTVLIRVRWNRTTGSDSLKVFGTWGCINGFPGISPTPPAVPSNQWQQLREIGVLSSFGRDRLRQWKSKIAKIKQGQTQQAIIACIGHSWWQFKDIWVPFRDGLQDLYGDAGVGYISFYHGNLSNSYDGYTLTFTGTWGTPQDEGTGALGVDLSYERVADVSTPGGWSIVTEATDFDLYYLLDPNAGSFQWRVDSGSWSSDVSAAAATGVGKTTISGLTNASHTLEVKMTVAGSLPGIKWFGVDARKSVAGARVHKAGNGGSHVQDWLDADETVWKAALAALTPDVVLIEHDINDRQGALVDPENPKSANIDAVTLFLPRYRNLIARVRSAVPTADIVLVSSGESTNTATWPHFTFVDATRALAAEQQTGYYNAYQTLGTWAAANARGLMRDNSHVNEYGGQLIASDLIHDLFQV